MAGVVTLDGVDDADTALVHLLDLLPPEVGSSIRQGCPLGLDLLPLGPLERPKYVWSVSHGIMGGGRGGAVYRLAFWLVGVVQAQGTMSEGERHLIY
jgi:hypothetical protein